MLRIKSVLFFLITLTVGVVFFLVVGGDVDWGDVTTSLALIRPWQFALIFILSLAAQGAVTSAWREALRHMGYRLPWKKLWRILVVGGMISFLTPVAFIGGEALILYLLKREMNVPWKRGINSLIVLKLADFVVHITFILIGLVVFIFLAGLTSLELISLFILVPLGMMLFLSYFFIQILRKKSIAKPVLRLFGLARFIEDRKSFNLDKEEGEIISFFDFKQRKSWALMGPTIVRCFFSWAQSFFLIVFLTGQTSVLFSLVAQTFAELSTMFLLPATLGSLEFMQVIAFGALGYGSSVAISFSLIWRGMRLAICALGIFYFFYFAGHVIRDRISTLIYKGKKLIGQNKNPPA